MQAEKTAFYVVAKGPEGLTAVLDKLPKNQADNYVFYQIGDLQALIKVDTTQAPFHFWYCDLLGRRAPEAVKNIIKAHVEDDLATYFHDRMTPEMVALLAQQSTNPGGVVSDYKTTLEDAKNILDQLHANQTVVHAKRLDELKQTFAEPAVATSQFSFWHHKEQSPTSQPQQPNPPSQQPNPPSTHGVLKK